MENSKKPREDIQSGKSQQVCQQSHFQKWVDKDHNQWTRLNTSSSWSQNRFTINLKVEKSFRIFYRTKEKYCAVIKDSLLIPNHVSQAKEQQIVWKSTEIELDLGTTEIFVTPLESVSTVTCTPRKYSTYIIQYIY